MGQVAGTDRILGLGRGDRGAHDDVAALEAALASEPHGKTPLCSAIELAVGRVRAVRGELLSSVESTTCVG